MQSLAYLPASNGVTNASVATVQNIRSALASTILVNTVSGWPTKFYGTMGTPHTFTDPVTSEIITIISDATAVDFAGHLDTGHIEIDAIAPGYTDLGSKVGDIVIVRPVTEWSNNLKNILGQSLNDDGTIKNAAITYNPNIFDYVVPGGAILAGLGYGSTLTASLSAGSCWINGLVQTIAAVATRTYTASKDTYVDALYNASGTATIVYTEVANNAASPALAANSIRLGIVVSGANIASVASINQGQISKLLPIISSIPLAFTDSLGNIICPRDPQRRTVGYTELRSSQALPSSLAALTGLSARVLVLPSMVGRKLEFDGRGIFGTTVDNSWFNFGIFEGATELESGNTGKVAASNTPIQVFAMSEQDATSGLHTYNLYGGNGSSTILSNSSNPTFLRIRMS